MKLKFYNRRKFIISLAAYNWGQIIADVDYSFQAYKKINMGCGCNPRNTVKTSPPQITAVYDNVTGKVYYTIPDGKGGALYSYNKSGPFLAP